MICTLLISDNVTAELVKGIDGVWREVLTEEEIQGQQEDLKRQQNALESVKSNCLNKWGGVNKQSIDCFFEKSGMSIKPEIIRECYSAWGKNFNDVVDCSISEAKKQKEREVSRLNRETLDMCFQFHEDMHHELNKMMESCYGDRGCINYVKRKRKKADRDYNSCMK